MKFAVVGGDERSVRLCALLAEDGHRVHTYALEKAELPPEAPKAGCLQGCVYGADWVLLPLPAEKSGAVNAPFAASPPTLEELLSTLWPGQVLCGGALSADCCLLAAQNGVTAADLMQRQGFTVGNAVLTAEGAIELLMKNSPRSLWRSRVLVTGWGRVGRLLSLRLLALGAEVTVAARKEGDRAMARALGLKALAPGDLGSGSGTWHLAVNTVPARILDEAALRALGRGTLLLELASAPGGFDRAQAESLGLKALAAPGLPGRCAPQTAAELIREAIYDMINEQED